jgi:gamma-glutamylcyclotransferase (GGCT)/AIG2-like uncharacterized protein YtfP
MNTIFVYGTLLDVGVLASVLGREESLPEYRRARLHGYSKHGLNILEEEGAEVTGAIIDVNDDDMVKLDRYEGVPHAYYNRIPVTAEVEFLTADEWETEPVSAIAYQINENYAISQ